MTHFLHAQFKVARWLLVAGVASLLIFAANAVDVMVPDNFGHASGLVAPVAVLSSEASSTVALSKGRE